MMPKALTLGIYISTHAQSMQCSDRCEIRRIIARFRLCSPVFVVLDHGVGRVIVNRLEIFRFDGIGINARLGVEAGGNVAHHVFNEFGIVVGVFSHIFFIRPLEQAVEFAGSNFFDEPNDFLNPDQLSDAGGHGHMRALVMGAAFGNFFGTGT